MTSEALLPRPGREAPGPDEAGAGPAARALLLAPSRGLGGGIERYVQTVQSAFQEAGVTSRRLDLARPGPAGHLALLAASKAALRAMTGPVRLVIAHRALLPVAALLNRSGRLDGISVICHGSDVWGNRWAARPLIEGLLLRGADVRLVAVSSFTAGALVHVGPATILPPGLSRDWFSRLVSAADQAVSPAGPGAKPGAPGAELRVMTAFRLAEWQDKGLPQLTAAISALGQPGIRLTVCGSGEPPAGLLAHVRQFPWCALEPGLSDAELAGRFARSDLFVLATRTRAGRRPSGEGFGLVLLEAQVAGTAVIGPAHGGSPDAYLDGVTGATPRDEGVPALTEVLAGLTRQPDRLADMGARGASWARASFAPERYASLTVSRLL